MSFVNRRAVLRGLGGLLISLPVLEGCTRSDDLPTAPGRETKAAARQGLVGAPAKRFICLLSPDGVEPDLWFPTGTESDFALNQQNAPLQAIKEHVILMRGINNQVAVDSVLANGHAEGVQSLLTGQSTAALSEAKGPSIDQLMADMHRKNGYLGRARGIHLGAGPGVYGSTSINANHEYEDLTLDMSVLFDSSTPKTVTELQNARLRNKSVLDGSRADFTRLSKRVSGEDKRRIESHLQALRDIEQRFSAEGGACPNPKLPLVADTPDGDKRYSLYIDIVVAAMACDAARTATLAPFPCGATGQPNLNFPALGINDEVHNLSHNIYSADLSVKQRASADFVKFHQWFSQKTVELTFKMKAVAMPDGGTLFDDVVLFQGSDLSTDHGHKNMAFLIAAGAKTPLRTGRFVNYALPQLHTHLLTTLLHAFGIDANSVGDLRYAPGNLDRDFLRG